ncbi:MAG: alternative ribosome rescue aminoacyl-tRNA hydrolase ArfB [Acidimicrobiales bacterium]
MARGTSDELDGPLAVNGSLTVPAAELVWRFSASGGPGGQHANTTNSRAEVVYDIAASAVLSERQREMLTRAFGNRVAVSVDDTRSQARNRSLARQRLAERLRAALVPSRTRRATKPGRRARQRRLDAKRRRSDLKSQRRRPPID